MLTNPQTTNPTRPARSGLFALYVSLAVIGTVLTYAIFLPVVVMHGQNPAEFSQQATSSPIAILLTLDILLSSLVFWIFMWSDAKRHHLRGWRLFIIPNLCIGLFCALALYLLWREAKINTVEVGGHA